MGLLDGKVAIVTGGRLRGWTVAGEYQSQAGGAVEPGELVGGLPGLYGTAPTGRVG